MSSRPRVYLDVAVGSAPPARVVFELRPDVAPRTCANFIALCSGDRRKKNKGVVGGDDGNSATTTTTTERDPLWFKGTTFHRIIPG